jgi:hypothetical protein
MGMMRRMLSMRDLKAQDLQGLSPEAVTALAAQMLDHIDNAIADIARHQARRKRPAPAP